MDRAELLERLSGSDFAVLATVDGDRGVHAVPIVFAVEGEQVVVPIDRVKAKRTTALRRVRNLEADGRATLLVDRRSDRWDELWWVRADLVLVDHIDVSDVVESLAAKYPQYSARGSVALILRFDITHVSGWSAR